MTDNTTILVGGKQHGTVVAGVTPEIVAFDWLDDKGKVRGYTNPLSALIAGHPPDYVRVSEDMFASSEIRTMEELNEKIGELVDSDEDDDEVSGDFATGYAAALKDLRLYIDKQLQEFE